MGLSRILFPLEFIKITDNENNPKDYILSLSNTHSQNLSLNFFLDDYYYLKENNENFKSYRNSILKLILDTLDLVVGDDLILFSSITKLGKEEVLKKIENLVVETI